MLSRPGFAVLLLLLVPSCSPAYEDATAPNAPASRAAAKNVWTAAEVHTQRLQLEGRMGRIERMVQRLEPLVDAAEDAAAEEPETTGSTTAVAPLAEVSSPATQLPQDAAALGDWQQRIAASPKNRVECMKLYREADLALRQMEARMHVLEKAVRKH
ncbi:MAG TPA: hypothetical protein VK348_00860 [Planctomycetota bacterium]|nr:hypothetical protein [Planctomycetota bacterium]